MPLKTPHHEGWGTREGIFVISAMESWTKRLILVVQSRWKGLFVLSFDFSVSMSSDNFESTIRA